MPFNVERLRRHVDPQWCSLHPVDVRGEAGDADMFIGDLFVTGGFVKGPRQTDRTVRVPCVAARSLPSCELVKIDTEGSEAEIIGGLDLIATRVVLPEHHARQRPTCRTRRASNRAATPTPRCRAPGPGTTAATASRSPTSRRASSPGAWNEDRQACVDAIGRADQRRGASCVAVEVGAVRSARAASACAQA